MSQTFCVEDSYVCVDRWYVRDGETIWPGKKVVDIVVPDGTTRTLISETWAKFFVSDKNAALSCEDDIKIDVMQLPSGAIVPLVPHEDFSTKASRARSRRMDAFGLAAYTMGLKNVYQGEDETSAEKKNGRISYSGGETNYKVYTKGKYLGQAKKELKKGTARSSEPHPSTSCSISNAKAVGALLPCFG